MCILGFHKWRFLKIYHYNDISYGGKSSSTGIIYICKRCYAIKNKSYYGVGFLTEKELGLSET